MQRHAYNMTHTHETYARDCAVSNQIQYSLLDRRPENGMLAFALDKGIRIGTEGRGAATEGVEVTRQGGEAEEETVCVEFSLAIVCQDGC